MTDLQAGGFGGLSAVYKYHNNHITQRESKHALQRHCKH
jgi:hypothetical protein